MLQLMAGAERLCHILKWGREMKKVGNHCSESTCFATYITTNNVKSQDREIPRLRASVSF